MKFSARILHSFQDVQHNLEQIEQQAIYTGVGVPTFQAEKTGAFYLRKDTPTMANQRIYIYDGSTWTGIL